MPRGVFDMNKTRVCLWIEVLVPVLLCQVRIINITIILI